MSDRKLPQWIGPAVIGGTLAVLLWLERRNPLRDDKPEPDWRRLPRNMAMAAALGTVVNVCERPLVQPVAKWVDQKQKGLLPSLNLPPTIEKALGLVLSDYSLYWWHILLHRVPFLWRSHIVHHADLILDTSTALRFHVIEFFASIPWRIAQVAIIGLRPETLALWQRLTLIEVMFHHSNVRLPIALERRLSQLVMTPRLHGIHHSIISEEMNSNFSSGLTVWDKLHGSLKQDIPQEQIEIGVPAYRDPQELKLPDLLALPFHISRHE